MTNKQRQFFIDTIYKQFGVKVDFSAILPKGYKLIFPENVEPALKSSIKAFYEAINKK